MIEMNTWLFILILIGALMLGATLGIFMLALCIGGNRDERQD